ncbi:hypothetical protein BDV37DRAFT_264022 [Aspergillus pseudonomiae]|uniref:Uncharacterized protein n=1 Tax=Aspergillus pseudonomiae TaxID=1506151 RepID=A0A5N7CVC8_9EURO|nr:uncharacterized protein BDV37DRAFT_264022 [Aspergillus pseudonomiae]KAE8398150.1 hypothetical protein BDV37DRAFT_264022 [Aspergillus pseudonomiae]
MPLPSVAPTSPSRTQRNYGVESYRVGSYHPTAVRVRFRDRPQVVHKSRPLHTLDDMADSKTRAICRHQSVLSNLQRSPDASLGRTMILMVLERFDI